MKIERKTQWINASFALALAILMIVGWLSYRDMEAMVHSDQWENRAYAATQQYDRLLSALQDAETGQRGYIITGEEEYLEPYNNALKNISVRLDSLKSLAKGDSRQQKKLNRLNALIAGMMAEMKRGIELRRARGFEAASHLVVTDRGKMLMDEIRSQLAEDDAEEAKLLQNRAKEKAADVRRTVQTVIGGSVLSFVLLSTVFVALKREIAEHSVTENQLLLHRKHLQELVDERTLEVGNANALLQTEIEEHKNAEEALRKIRDELEFRVKERTAKLSQTIAVLNDEVAQRTYAEQTLRERTEQLRLLASELNMAEQKERERLAGVLHDGLQQILVAAKYYLALIEHRKDAKKTTEEVAHLIDDAIEISRSMTAELSPPILHEGGFVPALDWLARWMHDKHGLAVHLTCREPIESPPEDVGIFLFQSIRELLFNVVKHSGVNSANIEIERRDDRIRIAVADEGSGFDPARLRAAGGAAGGFGLFSLSERLSHMKGLMEINSSPGGGSRIMLSAPFATPALQSAPSTQEKDGISLAVAFQQSSGDQEEEGIRIVLVDDHVVMRQGLSSLLRAQPKMQVVGEASDGRSALELARRIRPDIVLMDIGLPDMSGVEVTRIIGSELPEVRIIGLSMFEEQAEAMRTAGAADYVSKNGPSEAVIEAIHSCILTSEQKKQSAHNAHAKFGLSTLG